MAILPVHGVTVPNVYMYVQYSIYYKSAKNVISRRVR